MKFTPKTFLIITLISIVSTLLVWAPFALRLPEFWSIPLPSDGMATIVANYDGPLYIVVAKSLYATDIIKTFSFTLPVEYYAAHFPLYPIFIRIVGTFTGMPWSSLIVTMLSSIFALFYFHKLIGKYVNKSDALWITFVFALFPARWLIVRSVGSPEPLFIGAVIASIYYFQNKKYWLAGIFGLAAQLTKSPGMLLFLAYAGFFIFPKIREVGRKTLPEWLKSLNWKSYPVLLIPLSLLGLFVVYSQTFDDFLAYFHSGDNIHLLFPPFQIFDYSQPWVGTFWLEEIIFVYLFGLLGIVQLIKQEKWEMAWFVGIFFTTIIFVSHRDIIRYSLPIVPFIYVAFAKYLATKEFKIIFILLLLPIYLFSIAYISQNVMPISDWSPLL